MADPRGSESTDDFKWTDRVSLGMLGLGIALVLAFIVLVAAFHISMPIMGLVGAGLAFVGGITQHLLMVVRPDTPIHPSGAWTYPSVPYYAMGMAHAGLWFPVDPSDALLPHEPTDHNHPANRPK